MFSSYKVFKFVISCVKSECFLCARCQMKTRMKTKSFRMMMFVSSQMKDRRTCVGRKNSLCLIVSEQSVRVLRWVLHFLLRLMKHVNLCYF